MTDYTDAPVSDGWRSSAMDGTDVAGRALVLTVFQ